MKTQDEIIRQQNSEDMLKCQYAARYYYNRAEACFWTIIGISTFNILSMLIPEFESPYLAMCSRFVLAFLDVVVVLLFVFMNKNINHGATLRNYFDDIVLGLSVSPENTNESAIQTLIYKAIKHNKNNALISIQNTAYDNPPGVKNWYTFAEKYSDDEAVFRCQKQNNDWTYELFKKKIILFVICLLFSISTGIIMYTVFHVTWDRMALCLVSAIVFLIERIIVEWRYYSQTMKIKNNCEICEKTRTIDQINQLQCSIAQLRHIPVIGINALHKSNASDLSDKFESISSRLKK